LAAALWRYWLVRGYASEGLVQLGNVLPVDLPRSLDGDPAILTARANALLGAGHLALTHGDHGGAHAYLEESLALSRRLEYMPGIASSLGNLALLARERGDYQAARGLLQEALSVTQVIRARWGTANVLRDLGMVALYDGDYAEARSQFEQSLEICTELDHEWGIAYALASLASLELRTGDRAAADHDFKRSLALGSNIDDKQIIAQCLEGLAVAAAEGTPRRAATLWGAAHGLRETTGTSLPVPDREYLRRAIDPLRAGMDSRTWDAAWAEGRAMPLREVVALALVTGEQHSGEERKPAAPYPDDLTAREVEVLGLLAAGLSNAEIAERLFLSRRTVHAHIRSIYGKIGVNTRSAATRYAAERGLA
jgi:ATP/maltotriose-dependent transcriptional regulator MalT